MHAASKFFSAVLLILLALTLLDLGPFATHAEARSRAGGRSFGNSRSFSPPPSRMPSSNNYGQRSNSGGFMRGLAGGLVGGALGSMLFGGMANAGLGGGLGGSGIGLFQILILGGIAYFVYTRFFKKSGSGPSGAQSPLMSGLRAFTNPESSAGGPTFPPPPPPGNGTVAEGIATIRRAEPDFDPEHFKEVAQDVFFQVQAGWMRRDLSSYEHLLDDNLAREYEASFAEMRQKGQLNKLENIAVRHVELVDAGLDGEEEFVTIRFTANLLDYTIDEVSGALVEGSMTTPVKFVEKWTWSRPQGESNWKLAGIEIP